MNVYYEGTDMRPYAIVRECAVRDSASGRADSLEILFEDAEKWMAWHPNEDDRISVSLNGYESGTMYVNTVSPENGKYRVYATALKCAARRKEYKSYKDRSAVEILRLCALQTGMESAAYGLDGLPKIPYIEQNGESAAKFLDGLFQLEGAAFKCVHGKYVAIGILWAQAQAAAQTIRLTANQEGASYLRSGETLRALTIVTPEARVTAVDTNAPDNHTRLVKCGLPAGDLLTAGRWARGLLLNMNRRRETLALETAFSPATTAMTRVDVTGGTEMDGQWLVEEVTHDLKNERTRAILHRNLETVR